MLIILFTHFIYSQTEYKVYIPMRTYHFERSEITMIDYHNTEGGNLGAILIRSVKVSKKGYIQQHLGGIRNSYGDLSIVGQVAYVYRVNDFDFGGSIGIATGYQKAYEYADALKTFPGILKNNGILPTTNLTICYTKWKIQPLLVISPVYINGGIIVKII